MKQIPLAIAPEPEASFDSFVPGANAASGVPAAASA